MPHPWDAGLSQAWKAGTGKTRLAGMRQAGLPVTGLAQA